MQIAEQTVVHMHYTLKDASGEVLDSSEGKDPLGYLHGAGNIVPGLEKALDGKEPGEEVEVTVTPDEGYGPRHDDLIQPVDRENFQGVDKIEPGMQFQAQTEAGPRVVTVVEVDEQQVTVDANHPLAGQELHFQVQVTDVREATEEEIQQGRAA